MYINNKVESIYFLFKETLIKNVDVSENLTIVKYSTFSCDYILLIIFLKQ